MVVGLYLYTRRLKDVAITVAHLLWELCQALHLYLKKTDNTSMLLLILFEVQFIIFY